jgi:hypothetical protein
MMGFIAQKKMSQRYNASIVANLAALVLIATTAFAGKQGRIDLQTMVTPRYTVEQDAFVRHNGERYWNRPLYCNHIYAIVLAGDKPCAMVGKQAEIFGNLMFALVRNGRGTWLQNASDITSKYRPGRMEWIVGDQAWGATTVHLEIVPTAQGAGMAARVRVENAEPGDTLVWASGAATVQKSSILWVYDQTSLKSGLEKRGFVPDDCKNNDVMAYGDRWTVQASATDRSPMATGRCSAPTQIVIGDAGGWENPAALLASHGSEKPIACGSVPVASDQYIYWSLLGSDVANGGTPADAFAAGMAREVAIENRVVVDTPDPWLNAGVGASSIVVDACYRDGVYTHSGMRWATALLGWRTVFGGTVFGWHDLVKDDAALFISKQITHSDYTTAVADPKARLSSQAPNSRMFGKGRIDLDDPHHYDMQSQFFDQIEHAWRWTGDPELQKLLNPSLDLHCQYIKDCFDPAGLGIYESYANTWPTDDQYYNGGGTSEETAYAYRAELTALQLARRAGDQQGIQLHSAAVDRIRKGFFDLLWIPDKGYPGAYREQYGLKRLHESCWLYAIFCPIDAGLLTTEQSAEALQYTEWGLERMPMPYGGEQCWPSNWVPSIWSVREMWSGDDYQLALAYFQTGLPDDGWKVFRGMFPQQELFGPVPGDMGHPAGGTDFNDCNSMFARTVVEGMFGYTPDYPNGIVNIAPQFPSDWDHASIKTPDMSIAYRTKGTDSGCKITLAKPCAMKVQLPVSSTAVDSVTVDGNPVKWRLLPGFGRSLVEVEIPSAGTADVAVTTQDALKPFPAIHLSGSVGDPVTLTADNGTLIDFHDPQGVLQNGKIEKGKITATLGSNTGDHVVFGLAAVGATQQWRMFKIHVTDVKADNELAAKTNVDVPSGARFDQVDMQPQMNGDIRTIYQQQYVSPRPNTCSLRLGTDGYSSWQMSLGAELHTPKVGLDLVGSLSDGHGNILAGKGVPFRTPEPGKNIAFTSRWDNWPRQVDVPVNKAGTAAWFLLCGTTNPMEVRIPNAELRMIYADGVVEKMQIVPPFNFWTLCPFSGNDYDYTRDAFALPKTPPTTVQLGQNCRAILLGWHLRPGVPLKSVTLETLSEEVVIGLMGVTVME